MASVTQDTGNEQPGRTERDQQLVLFQLGQEDYGVNIYSVQRLIQVPEITRVPRAPGYVEGVIDVRGDIIPVVNLKKRFGFDHTQVGDNGRVVITEIGEQIVGFLVDAVSEVTRLANEDIEPPNAVVLGDEADYVAGIGKQAGAGTNSSRLIIVLDVRKVLAIDEVQSLRDVGNPPEQDTICPSQPAHTAPGSHENVA